MAPGDLERLVQGLVAPVGGDVLVGAETGDDAAVVRVHGDLCAVLTADFITPVMNDPRRFGQVAAANALSDVFAMGGRAVAALNLCFFPEKGIPQEDLRAILQGAADTAGECGCSIVGGHTVSDEELKFGLSVMGLVRESDVKRNSTARAGDRLILGKPIGTGVTINGARKGYVTDEQMIAAVEVMAFLNERAARLMVEHGASAATDVTGFGLARHAHQMARASGVRFRLSLGAVPRFPWAVALVKRKITSAITEGNRSSVAGYIALAPGLDPAEAALLFDPQTSGGLLISVGADRADRLLADLRHAGYPEAAIVGEVREGSPGAIEVGA